MLNLRPIVFGFLVVKILNVNCIAIAMPDTVPLLFGDRELGALLSRCGDSNVYSSIISDGVRISRDSLYTRLYVYAEATNKVYIFKNGESTYIELPKQIERAWIADGKLVCWYDKTSPIITYSTGYTEPRNEGFGYYGGPDPSGIYVLKNIKRQSVICAVKQPAVEIIRIDSFHGQRCYVRNNQLLCFGKYYSDAGGIHMLIYSEKNGRLELCKDRCYISRATDEYIVHDLSSDGKQLLVELLRDSLWFWECNYYILDLETGVFKKAGRTKGRFSAGVFLRGEVINGGEKGR